MKPKFQIGDIVSFEEIIYNIYYKPGTDAAPRERDLY
jgi:hypothetical protein